MVLAGAAALGGDRGHHRTAIREPEGGLERLGEPRPEIRTHPKPVHDRVQIVMDGPVQPGRRIEIDDPTVHPRPHEAAGAQRFEDLVVLPLATPHQRSQQHEALAGRPGQDRVDHLAHRLRLEHDVVFEAAGIADPCEQQPQVVMNLGYGADRRAGVAGTGALLDGDGGREPLDVIDIRLVHHREELARVGGQGFHVPAPSLGVDRVEGEGRLAGPGEPP